MNVRILKPRVLGKLKLTNYLRFFTIGLVSLMLLVACNPLAPLSAKLKTQKQAWQAEAIGSYELELQRICFCGPELTEVVKLTVSAGEIGAVVYRDTGEAVAEVNRQYFPDIDGLFGVLEDAIVRGAHSIEVSWDENDAFPKEISIDYVENAADEELGFNVLSFSPKP